MFKPGAKLFDYEVVSEAGENVMYINLFGLFSIPSLANPVCMEKTIDALIETPKVSKIIYVQNKNFILDRQKVELLVEVAQLYVHFTRQLKLLSMHTLTPFSCKKCLGARQNAIRYLIYFLFKRDPIACYVELKRLIREEKINAEKLPASCLSCQTHYIKLLEKLLSLIENLKLIQLVKDKLEGFKVGDRHLYDEVFRLVVVPNYMFTQLVLAVPKFSEVVDSYTINVFGDKAQVNIYKLPNKTKFLYHLTAPEFLLDEKYQYLVNLARTVLIEHKPKAEEFTDPERIRQVFFSIARDLLQELSETKNIKLNYATLNKLALILVRNTIGFGVLEILLQDEKLQDIVVNAPATKNPIFVRHQDFDECFTNIYLSHEDVNSWAAKFRMISGRPLDEANPILDTELTVGNARARVAIIQQPLSPYGLAYAFRRHREKPWTLPLFIQNKMINSLTAGLLSFLIDGARTMLIAGTRSSGKTSLLSACMLEIMPKYRIIVVEDTLELPVDSLQNLGYDILRMKVRSALTKETTEVAADEGIRTSLRLGDSCLIVGEVRSTEALALYEAMRVGALANVVAGTIHGASPYGVFDRVVNDLKVPATSFKATDLIVIANPIKSPDGLHRWRRVLQLAEVRKHWRSDPLAEKAFVDLLRYDVKQDSLKPTADLLNGDSEIIKAVASQVKHFAGNWDAVWENILLRARIKQHLVDVAEKARKPELLEAEFVVKANNAFHTISDDVNAEIGFPDPEQIFARWNDWLKKQIKKNG